MGIGLDRQPPRAGPGQTPTQLDAGHSATRTAAAPCNPSDSRTPPGGLNAEIGSYEAVIGEEP